MPTEPSSAAAPEVLAVLPRLEGGGAQRVMLTILAGLPEHGFRTRLATVQSGGQLCDALPPGLPVHDLGTRAVRYAAPALLRLIWRTRPAVVFSTIHYMNLYLLLLRPLLPPRTRVVVREAIAMQAALESEAVPRGFRLLHRALYRFADAVVVQCEAMARDLEGLGVPRRRMVTIFNPIDVAHWTRVGAGTSSPFAGSGPGPHVLAVGRLARQKGFDRLLQSVPALLARHPQAHVWVLGEDPGGHVSAARELEELRRSLRLEERVHLVGFQPEPAAWFAHADLFVLSSRYEGLPNVLLEALACGCPVVALDGPGGTRELLEACGLPERVVPELRWEDTWFRADVRADLTGFASDRILARYARVLRGDIAPCEVGGDPPADPRPAT